MARHKIERPLAHEKAEAAMGKKLSKMHKGFGKHAKSSKHAAHK